MEHVVVPLSLEERLELYNLVITTMLYIIEPARFPLYQTIAKKLLQAQPGIVATSLTS
jgi:hypothetical protein